VEAPSFSSAKTDSSHEGFSPGESMRLAAQQIRTSVVTAVTWQRRFIFRAESMAKLFLSPSPHG